LRGERGAAFLLSNPRRGKKKEKKEGKREPWALNLIRFRPDEGKKREKGGREKKKGTGEQGEKGGGESAYEVVIGRLKKKRKFSTSRKKGKRGGGAAS